MLFFMFTICTFFSCESNDDEYRLVNVNEKTPSETIKNLHLFYSDSGSVKIELIAAYSERYSNLKEKTIFRDSLRLNFYNEKGIKTTTLSALYGEFNDEEESIFVKDSVRLFNFEKNQILITNSLYWNKKDKTVYTKDSVWVHSPDGVASGKGIETKQDFTEYKILFPEGNLILNNK